MCLPLIDVLKNGKTAVAKRNTDEISAVVHLHVILHKCMICEKALVMTFVRALALSRANVGIIHNWKHHPITEDLAGIHV